MKKFVAFILAFMMILGTVANAAPGDIFHSGPDKFYKPDSPDLIDAILGGADVSQFYREIEGNKFINIVEEENRQVQYLQELKGQYGLNTPGELEDYIKANASAIKNKFEEIANEIAIDRDNVADSKLPRLESPYNYSKPVPGSEVNHTQIINLLLPKGGKAWVYEVGKEDFKDVKMDMTTKDMKSYSSGRNIPVLEGDYLFLAAVDGGGKLKAYTSIKISNDMINNPRVEANLVESLNPTFKKSQAYSGATNISGDLGPATWKLAPIASLDTVVYVDSSFADSKDYKKDGTDLILASDSQLDKDLDGFEDYIIIYSEKDKKIEDYKIFKLDKSVVSGLSEASRLKKKVEGSDDYNYSTPDKGNYAGTIQIEELNLEDLVGASRWMYAIVDKEDMVAKQDRVYPNSSYFEMGQDIDVLSGDNLMILATDDKGKVRAYDIIKILPAMIKDPLATQLVETTDYKGPIKGASIGSSEFEFLKHNGVTAWKYTTSDKLIDTPELASSSAGYSNVTTSGGAFNLIVEDDPIKLKANNFKKHMMIYGLNSDDEVIAYKDFIMDDSNVRMPLAGELVSPGNYSGPSKGSSANTTKFGELLGTGFGKDLKFRYKILDNPITEIEFNSKFPDTHELRPNINVPVSVDKDLLVLAVDSAHKTKAFTTIKLTFDHVQAGPAPKLDLKTNYVGPVPGGTSNSSSFSYLKAPTENSEFVYIIGDSKFDVPELGSTVTGTPLKMVEGKSEDITPLTPGKHLLLLAIEVGDEEGKGKVLAYEQFKLSEDQVKGGSGIELDQQAYKIMPGDNPSTTRLRLEALGITNPNSIQWRYKLVADKDPTDIPYFNQIVDSTAYPVKANTFLGPDIPVVKDTDGYGRILILATDRDGRTKAYANVPITKDDVKEHADKIVTLIAKGNIVDSVKFTDLTGLDSGNKYKYLISDSRPETPATGDDTPSGRIPYNKLDEAYPDIPVHIGKWISLYEVDSKGKVVKFNSFEVKEVAQGAATLTVNPPGDILEGSVVKGGTSFTITLADPKPEDGNLVDAKWADNITTKAVLDKLFQGFKANSETAEWARVVERMVAEGNANVTIVDKLLSITLSSVKDYNISQDQIINLEIPHEAIEGALNPIKADGSITIKPTVGASISGDVVNSIVREDDIKTGGKTIVIKLDDGDWVTDLASNPDNKKALIDGFSGDNNWNAIAENITDLVRTSKNEATITLPPMPTGISFGTTPSAVSLKIPKALIQGAGQDVVANPDFILYPNKIQVVGKAIKDSVTLQAPDFKIVDTGSDTWIVQVTRGTLEDKISDKDLDILGLPRGLKANVSRVDGENQIQIKITENASSSLSSNIIVKLKIKGSAVTDPNAEDSEELELKLVRGGSNIDSLKNVEVDIAGGMLMDSSFTPMKQLDSSAIEFSLDSSTGINGEDWVLATAINTKDITFKPGKVFVRDANNKRVYHLVATIANYPKAPTGIKLTEADYSQENIQVQVHLDGYDANKDYEVSIDGGKTWDKDLSISGPINLDDSNDLRVRLKATEKALASLATARLNGLYLGDVKLEVGRGLISGTDTSMQFSLNSTNGIDGNWDNARSNETPVNLTAGNRVWIRQQTSKVNYRPLGKVEAEDRPVIEENDITYNIGAGTITNKTDQILEYKVDGGQWTKMKTKDEAGGLTDKVIFAPGDLEIRTAGTTDKLPSQVPVLLANIPEPIETPELKYDDDKEKMIYYLSDNDSWVELDDNFQYTIGSNDQWTAGTKLKTDDQRKESVVVYVRKAATATRLPSKEKSISFTKNLSFENIIFDIKNKEILGTTDKMEYSINSQNVLNGIWTPAGNGTTSIEPFEGMYIWIREIGKPSTTDLYINKLARLAIPNVNTVYYNVSTRKIANNSSYNLEYRINAGDWLEIDAKTDIYDVKFEPGKLEFRQRSTNKMMESHPKLKATIQAKSSGPKVEVNDITNVISISSPNLGKDKFEYRINPSGDNTPWISGELLAGENLEGDKIVEVRIRADKDTLSSQITQVKLTKNLELGHIRLSTFDSPLVLNGTTSQMEYAIWLGDDDNNYIFESWVKCDPDNKGNTKLPAWLNIGDVYKIEIRDIQQPENIVIVYLKP